MDSSDLSDGAVTLQEYLELKKALAASEAKVQQLMKGNSSLSDELRRLQREVRRGLPGPAGRGRGTLREDRGSERLSYLPKVTHEVEAEQGKRTQADSTSQPSSSPTRHKLQTERFTRITLICGKVFFPTPQNLFHECNFFCSGANSAQNET